MDDRYVRCTRGCEGVKFSREFLMGRGCLAKAWRQRPPACQLLRTPPPRYPETDALTYAHVDLFRPVCYVSLFVPVISGITPLMFLMQAMEPDHRGGETALANVLAVLNKVFPPIYEMLKLLCLCFSVAFLLGGWRVGGSISFFLLLQPRRRSLAPEASRFRTQCTAKHDLERCFLSHVSFLPASWVSVCVCVSRSSRTT